MRLLSARVSLTQFHGNPADAIPCHHYRLSAAEPEVLKYCQMDVFWSVSAIIDRASPGLVSSLLCGAIYRDAPYRYRRSPRKRKKGK